MITLAGSGGSGTANGAGTAASFSTINGLAFDPSTTLTLVATCSAIRAVTTTGVVSTLAGGGYSSSQAGIWLKRRLLLGKRHHYGQHWQCLRKRLRQQ